MQKARFLPVCGLALFLGAVPSCTAREGDPPSATGAPSPAGRGHRIHEVADPDSPLKAAHGSDVSVTGAVAIAVDQYDETRDGKSSGTIYVADLGSAEPYSGISLYNPSFIPGNLRVAAGDTLDLRGQFQENQDIPLKFAPGAFLIQLANPIGAFRFEAHVPDPIDLDEIEEKGKKPGGIALLSEYATGRKWLNMLVRVKNVTLASEPKRDPNGNLPPRASYDLMPSERSKCEEPFPKAPTLVNELTDLSTLDLQQGTVIESLTGVVTFFCNLHIAPRSAADVVLKTKD